MNDPTPTDDTADDDDTPAAPALRPTPYEFRPDPRGPNRLVWRSPAGPMLLALARAVVFGSAALAMGVGAPLVFASMPEIALSDRVAFVVLLAAVGAGVAALAVHYAFDARGRGRNLIVLHARHVEFDLAAHRSLTEDTPRAADRVYYNDMAYLETRLEIYRAFGVPMRQRKFRLVPKSGEPVLLFEDRNWSTDMESSHARLAITIAERARVPLRDRGQVEGRSGLLGIVGATAPEWETPGRR